MISFNPKKAFDFLFIVISSFVVAMTGNYFFEWDFQFGLTVGLILGVWSVLFDISAHIVGILEEDDDDEDEIPERMKRR